MAEAVRAAGFTPGEMTITATGAFERTGDELHFRIRGWREAYPAHSALARAAQTDPIHARVDYASSPPRLLELK